MSSDLALITQIADSLPVGVWVARAPSGELAYANREFRMIMGMEARPDVASGSYGEPYGIRTRDGEPYPEDRMPFVRALRERGTVTVDDIVIHRADGGRVNIRAFATPMFDLSGEMTHVIVAFIDITREVQAVVAREEGEARLRHAQRMDSVGSLAGGIAHDFNNLLAGIKLMVSRLAIDETVPERTAILRHIDEVTDSAVTLTRGLLRFARRTPEGAELVSLGSVVDAVARLATRMVDRRIDVVVASAAGDACILGDRSQLEQVVMNLTINARDAMSGAGALTLKTYEETISEEEAASLPPLKAGRIVVLEIEDTGAGIEPGVVDRVFEPYFTTKLGAVRGTGLGLATVYGIVRSHGGMVDVKRTSSSGTTLRARFPRAAEADAGVDEAASSPVAEPGSPPNPAPPLGTP